VAGSNKTAKMKLNGVATMSKNIRNVAKPWRWHRRDVAQYVNVGMKIYRNINDMPSGNVKKIFVNVSI
jgi:hypothetical protein